MQVTEEVLKIQCFIPLLWMLIKTPMKSFIPDRKLGLNLSENKKKLSKILNP